MRRAGRAALALALLLLHPRVGGEVVAVAAAQATKAANPVAPRAPQDVSTIRVGLLKNGAYEVQSLPLENYVSRVVAGEAAVGSAPAALEAMAIAIRTFALANRGRHRADGFDLCDQTHCQVVRAATAKTDSATRATAGEVLLNHGMPASVYYSASCGGRTERPSAVWPGAEDPAYLPSQPDDACKGSPAWTAELTLADLRRALGSGGFRGKLRGVSIASRSDSGRVAQLRLDGVEPDRISGQDLRVVVGRTLGWQLLKSTAFELKKTAAGYRFAGHGSGHGVGMCVIGATHLAADGETAHNILLRYFPGLEIGVVGPRLVAAPSGPTIGPAPAPALAPAGAPTAPAAAKPQPFPVPGGRGAPTVSAPAVAVAGRALAGAAAGAGAVGTVPGADVRVSLSDEDEGDRAAIQALVLRARDDLAKALGIEAPSRLTVRFHPTIEQYEQATGQPWFTGGAMVADEAHFAPLVSLRSRGVLERTIRREVAHVLADPALGDRPLWVREGAALYFADKVAEGGTAGDGRAQGARVACPADAELRQPTSAGALADAFSRARSCFARQVAGGRSWRDVK